MKICYHGCWFQLTTKNRSGHDVHSTDTEVANGLIYAITLTSAIMLVDAQKAQHCLEPVHIIMLSLFGSHS